MNDSGFRRFDLRPPVHVASLPLSTRCSADVVVADYERGVELAARGSRLPRAEDCFRIMVVASCDREWEVRSALERGVRRLSPQVAQRLAESMSGETLTAREKEVLRLVVEGMGKKAIARRLDVAAGTVKSHLKGVFDKFNVESRTRAICATERRGLPRDLSQRMGSAEPAQSVAGFRPRLTEPPARPSCRAAAFGILPKTHSPSRGLHLQGGPGTATYASAAASAQPADSSWSGLRAGTPRASVLARGRSGRGQLHQVVHRSVGHRSVVTAQSLPT